MRAAALRLKWLVLSRHMKEYKQIASRQVVECRCLSSTKGIVNKTNGNFKELLDILLLAICRKTKEMVMVNRFLMSIPIAN